MAEYIEREELVRQIICNMAEFIGAPDDVQKHDEQCNYAINMIEDAPVADVAPVVHGRWVFGKDLPDAFGSISKNKYHLFCSECKEQAFNKDIDNDPDFDICSDYCPNCGAKMDGLIDDRRMDLPKMW